MSRSNSIKPNLADDGLGGPWEKNAHDSPSDSDGWTVSLLKSLIAASGKSVKEAAFDFGMSETHLADHCAGRRVLAAHRLDRFVQRNPDTAIVLAEAYLRRTNIKAVIRRKRVAKKTAREQMCLQLERSADVFDLIAEKTARALGASKQDVIDAWNETTGVEDEVK